ncbi:Rhodanese_domain-containing protein [Hexamita inflata]|uniref:Rhodanese domain-containing protein n=1 Tax=Hexamita inflata TaxID=28002 RepID=A0AA86RGN5_9EUKA|nr:Rhodanese domain-containing protein [Hexamita inflata]CAI9977520.1 Rhodanese domain-containing protein [Hexamita inflata]
MQFIDPEDIAQYPQALVIDVRDSDYNVDGHLKRSINIPISQLREQENLMKIEKFNTVICFCQMSKQRGPYAAYLIKSLYPKKDIYVVSHGYTNIKQSIPNECEK